MLLPYRCKNPPEHFPVATITLIVLNVVIYLFTTHDFLQIKGGIVKDYALYPSNLSPIRLITSMFLHEQPLHIIGNMLFLWLFGAAVEGRLRIPKFLLLYFVAGIVGGLTECWSETAMGSDLPGLGASGAIMGLSGAYVYIFPFARIMVFRMFGGFLLGFNIGTAEWLAWWVVGYYMVLNVLNGILAQWIGIAGGTAFFAHVGGFGAGLAMAFLLRVHRDSDNVSQIQAIRADSGNDLTILSATELEVMLEAPTENLQMVLVFCKKAVAQLGSIGAKKAIIMIERYKLPLLESANAGQLAEIVLSIPIEEGGMPGPFYLRLGGKLEQQQNFESAANIYRRTYDLYSTSPDGGSALMRLARIWEQVFSRPDLSHEAYKIYLAHFAKGPFVEDAQKGLDRVAPPQLAGQAVRRPPLQRDLTEQQMNVNEGNGTSPARSVAAPDLVDSPRIVQRPKQGPNSR